MSLSLAYPNLLAGTKRIPEIAAERAKWAAIYRQTRKDNPAMARLLYRRVKIASRRVAEDFWNNY